MKYRIISTWGDDDLIERYPVLNIFGVEKIKTPVFYNGEIVREEWHYYVNIDTLVQLQDLVNSVGAHVRGLILLNKDKWIAEDTIEIYDDYRE